MKFKYPLAGDTISKNDIDALIEWLSEYPRLTMGELTKKFERKWSNYIGSENSIFVNSGSSANLLMVYLGLVSGNLKKGDRVIVPSCGWSTSIAPIIQLGLRPVMVDANRYNFGVDVNQVDEICKEREIKGMVIVHPLGVPCDKDEMLTLKKKYNFFLMEDCCASVGAEFSDGTKVGTIGDVSSFSFYFGHQLSTIEGGFVNTNNQDYYQTMLMLRSHGWTKDISEDYLNKNNKVWNIDKVNEPFNFVHSGFNIRATDLQAFIGLLQLKKVERIMEARHKNHLRYHEQLSVDFQLQNYGKTWPVSLHIGILAKDSLTRDKVLGLCRGKRIETRVWSHGNLGRHPFWKENYGIFDGEWSNEIYNRGFILPTYPELNSDDIDYIASICNKY